MTRILITGAGGFLGHNLVRGLCARHEVFSGFRSTAPDAKEPTPVELDITKAAEVRKQISEIRPDLVVHSAAMSQPDECEREPVRAHDVIVCGTRNVASACREFEARMVHISTDLVFDGTRGWYREEDEVNGISVYANAKIEAERSVLSIDPDGIILRVALLFGIGSPSHPGSLVRILRDWRSGRSLTFYSDQYRTPAYAQQVVEVVDRLTEQPLVKGILHLGGADRVSRYEFAVGVAGIAGIDIRMVRSGRMSDMPSSAPRGADCSLVSEKICSELGVRPLRFSEALDQMKREGVFDRI